jgi:transcription antitermination factor NusB
MADPRGASRAAKRRVDTRDPRRSRERALKILFQADVRGVPAGEVLDRIADDPHAWVLLDDLDPDEAAATDGAVDADAADADPEPHEVARLAKRRRALQIDGFTRSLVRGVADHHAQLDELIQRYARRWTVARMPAIDRNVLRLGTYELAYETTSAAVVINEVIELAKRLSTEDSGRYVNGVLESVRKHLADHPLDGATDAELAPTVPDTAEPPPFDVELVEVLHAEPLDDAVAGPDASVPGGEAVAGPGEASAVGDDGPDAPEDADAGIVIPAPDEDELEPLEVGAVVDVLPPPDDDGDAIDLIADPTPDEPASAEDVDDLEELDDLDDADAVDEDDAPSGEDLVDPGAGQQQLF